MTTTDGRIRRNLLRRVSFETVAIDACLMSQVMGARGFQVSTADLPTVERITAACLEIDAFARALPLRQPGAPASH